MNCPKCGRPLETSLDVHRCAYVLHAEAGSFGITAQPVGLVVEGRPDSPEGRRVDSKPASGGRSFSRTEVDGGFTVELSGVLDRGRDNERHAIETLIKALRVSGRKASLNSEAQDERGEDGILILDGTRIGVQVVSVPAEPAVWKTLADGGSCEVTGTIDDAVKIIREALEHKRGKAVDTLLVLDAAHFGALVGPLLVQAYSRSYGNPEHEFSLAEAWLVGPTPRSVFRLA